MAREPWKCPYANCKLECSRRWNLERHIIRLHGGEGGPVKNNSAAGASKTTSLLSKYHDLSAVNGLYSRSKGGEDEKNKKGKEGKTTGEPDHVDVAYSTFRRWKDKNDKIEEMRNYFANYNSRTPSPPPIPQDIFNYGILNNILPYHVRSEFCSTPMPSSLTAPPVRKVQPKKVIGYVGVVCSNCLESESRQVIYDPNTVNNIFRAQHICDPQNIDSVKGYPRPKQESLIISKILGLSEKVTKTVKEWTHGGEIYLIPYKLHFGDVTKDTIILNVKQEFYLLFLNYEPRLPLEN
jgi:hypothetical protein